VGARAGGTGLQRRYGRGHRHGTEQLTTVLDATALDPRRPPVTIGIEP
jgi:hypothetical protein